MADSKGKQTRFEMIIGATDRFSGVFKTFNDRMDKGSAQINRMKKSVQGLSRATGLSRLTASVGGVATGMRNVAKEGKALVGTMAGLAGKASLLFGGAGAGLLALAKGTANAGSAALDAASRVGVGISTWQEYAHAANLSGVGNEQLEKSFRSLQDISIKAFKGDKTQASLLKMAGIDPKTAKGEIKNADSIMLELADKVKALRESGQDAKATNLVKSILGDQGAKLMPMLQGGAEGLKKMRMEAHDLGLVFSGEDADASFAFNSSIAKLSASFKGIGFTIGKVVLPPVTKLIDKFSAWAGGSRELIGTGFAEWVGNIDVDALWESIESGLKTLKNFGTSVNDIIQRFGGWKTVAIAVAAFMGGKFVWSIGSLIGSFGKLGFAVMSNPLLWKAGGLLGNATMAFGKFAVLLGGKVVTALASAAVGFVKFGLALMTTPIGWVIAGIAAIAGAAYLIYKNWEPIAAFFSVLWDGISQKFTGVWDGVMGKWDAIVQGFKDKIASLTKFMPDWVKEKMGLSMEVDAAASGDAAASAEPLNLAGTAKELNSRTEHVEKEKIELVVRTEDGASVTATRSGGRSGSNMSMQTGQQALAVN